MKTTKSTGLSFVLVLLFGPLGLFYASPLFGALLLVATIALMAANLLGGWLLSMFVVWPVCIICSIVLVTRNNKAVERRRDLAEEARHQEQLAAIGAANQQEG